MSDTGKQYILSVSPHILTRDTTRRLMADVIIALLPAVAAALYFFRLRAAMIMATCVISCVVFEYLYEKAAGRKISTGDYSAALTGVLLAMVLPPAMPLWACAIGALIAIVLTKQMFGGLGANIFNPALLGRAFLMAAFPVMLTTWSEPITLDAITGATPLGLFKFEHVVTGSWPLLLGNVSGSLGETSGIALIAGGLYLLARKVIDYRIPAAYILAVAGISFITHMVSPGSYAPVVFHLLAGGLLLGAFFMATDPVTSPVTKKGRWIFGAGCGVITMVIRLWGGLPEGVMYSILLMNALTPLINRATMPRRFGT
ncbi:MAG: RnfABCDGE type electron transport complex subunit D [Candidatus Omnitrophota bacterium]